MSRPWIFICPSSRGIGHALTRHLLRNTANTKTPIPILATSRTRDSVDSVKSRLLGGISDSAAENRLHVLPVDVTHEETIREASRKAADLFPRDEYHLHLAFALPGILHAEKSPAQIDYQSALES
jgi:NAD(P)-dependent dehydrogenase (short-subunit alcohol dehydrogenase family)